MRTLTAKTHDLLTGLFLARADGRIYACVRMAFALVALINLLMLWPHRGSFLADAGMIDQEITRQTYRWPYLTVFDWCRDLTSVSVVMIGTATAMLMLLAGWLPRLAALVVYVWHVSYAARGVTALCGWDTVLRCVSFLVLVSPLPSVWMLTKQRNKTPEEPPCYGLTLLRFQLLVIYWQTVLDRLDSQFWLSGEFMGYYLLSHNARWPVAWVADFDLTLRALTYLILIVEVALPVMLMTRRWHRAGLLIGFLFHFGIFVTSNNLLMFLLAMMVLYTAFLRSEDIDWLTKQARRLLGTSDDRQSMKRKAASKTA